MRGAGLCGGWGECQDAGSRKTPPRAESSGGGSGGSSGIRRSYEGSGAVIFGPSGPQGGMKVQRTGSEAEECGYGWAELSRHVCWRERDGGVGGVSCWRREVVAVVVVLVAAE